MRFNWYMLALPLLLLLPVPLLVPLLLLVLLYSVSHIAVRTGCCGGAVLADMLDSASLHHWNLRHASTARHRMDGWARAVDRLRCLVTPRRTCPP